MIEDRVAQSKKLLAPLFPEDKYRVLDCIKVEKTKNRKKKCSWLALTTDQNAKVYLHWIKEKDLTRKGKWKLQDIKTVDLKSDGDKDTVDFEIHVDRVFKWTALTVAEKEGFVRCLYRYSRCLPKNEQIHFKNGRSDLFEDIQGTSELAAKMNAPGSERELEVGEYQALTAKEERDLDSLMVKYKFAISNAEAFTEQLNRELANIDATNVQAIMESEKKVEALMTMFDTVIDEASQLEIKLDTYDNLLREVRDSVMRMEEKDAVIHVQNENIDKLRTLVENIVNKMDLSHEHRMIIVNPMNFESEESVRRYLEAATAMEEAMSVELHPDLKEMTAIKDQMKFLDSLMQSFTRNLSHYLNDQLIKISVDYGSGRRTLAAGEPVLRKHDLVHDALRPYSPLMAWLKRNNNTTYAAIKEKYLERFRTIYYKEILVFFEQANAKLRFEESRSASGTLDTKRGTLVLNAQEGASSTPTKSRTTCLLGMASEQFCAGEDAVARQLFDLFLERILTSLEPAYLSEQQFCIEFLDLTTTEKARRAEGLQVSVESSAISSGSRTPSKSTSVDDLDSVSHTSSDEMLSRLRKRDKDVSLEVRDVMATLFKTLEDELNKFVATYDGVYSMYLLVKLCHHTIQTEDAGSYLCKLYGMALVNAKRNFDQYMSAHISSINEAKPPRRNKCGILTFVSNFGEFATQCEAVFKGSDRRSDLQKWYSKIVHAIFEGIVRLSVEHGRTPPEVVCMENYHHMFTGLYELRILEDERKEAKERYQYALKSYVTNYFGRPLEKLNIFFEGVQARIDTGTKRSDVCFIHQYSKSELRKVIKEFPGREVKRGLEALYKKVEKHLSPEENLLQVVWRHMQDEFIRQYNAIQALLETCYSGSMISLEFTIDDLLEYFSDIAKQH